MAQGKFTDNLIKLRCEKCKMFNYYVPKNKKQITRKLEFKKYCSKCKAHTPHKEGKKK